MNWQNGPLPDGNANTRLIVATLYGQHGECWDYLMCWWSESRGHWEDDEGSRLDPDWVEGLWWALIEPPQDNRPIWEELAELTARVPLEEWANVPTDLAENLHHYLYGTPKSESPKEDAT